MSRIDWKNSFSVGNDEIDAQHKKWIAIFNNMHEALINGAPADYKAITMKSIQDMMDYSKVHFAFEEKYMATIKYPEIVAHARIHKDFDNLIYQYFRDAEDGKIVLNTELISMIKNWLMQHILVEDIKYKLFSQQRK